MASTNHRGESSSFSEDWRHRILIPTILAGVAGGGVGLVSKYRKVHGLANISATYATNFAIVTGCYCALRAITKKSLTGIPATNFMPLVLAMMKMEGNRGYRLLPPGRFNSECFGAREFVRVTRKTGHDDLVNSAIAGFGTGAILGRLQGGQFCAYRYSLIFAVVGTAVDFAALKLRPKLHRFSESMFDKNSGSLKLPEWSPIQVLDEEALAAKRAREEKLYAQRKTLSKEESEGGL